MPRDQSPTQKRRAGRGVPSSGVRLETGADAAAVRQVHLQAFGRPGEADLVERIRLSDRFEPGLSLVAEREGLVVGHILLSWVDLAGAVATRVLALAPMAVLPAWQGQGVGSALVRAALGAAASLPAPLVVVLGHDWFYPRFGFAPARGLGVSSSLPVDDEFFMARRLPAYRPGIAGRVVYPPTFALP